MFVILITIIVLIVYGSLYPWQFHWHTLPASPLYLLFHSWTPETTRRLFADAVVNVALYVPLGMAAWIAFRQRWGRLLSMAGALALGGLLSGCVEMAQLFTPSRDCSAVDLTNNVIGCATGIALGALFERLVAPRLRGRKRRLPDPAALGLLFCGIAWILFPIFPVISLFVWKQKLSLLLHGPVFDSVRFLSGAGSWFAAGRLLQSVDVRHPGLWLAFALLLIPAQIAVVSRQPAPVDLFGAAVGFALFAVFGKTGKAGVVAGWGFLVLLAFRGLAPLRLTAHANSFSFVPFGGFLETEWQTGLRIFLEKVFYYGSAIWLLRGSGLRLRTAVPVVTAALGAIEIAQTHIPGRTPEITDPLLALLLGGGIGILSRRRVRAVASDPADFGSPVSARR